MEITVIMTVYNGSAFLAEAIRSVIGQTAPPSEFIIADDGSTDDSAQIAESYASSNPQFPIRVLRFPHRGVCAARNAVLREVKSEWLFNLDADNRIDPDFLEKITAFVSARSDDPKFAFAYPDRVTFGEYTQLRKAEDFEIEKFKTRNLADSNSAMRTDLVRSFGFDPEFDKGWQDYDLFLSMSRAGYRGAAFRSSPLRYRIHRGSKTAQNDRSELMRKMTEKHKGFWTNEEAEKIRAEYSPEAMLRFRLFELLWAKRYGAMILFALKCLFFKPRVFFSKNGIPKLFKK